MFYTEQFLFVGAEFTNNTYQRCVDVGYQLKYAYPVCGHKDDRNRINYVSSKY